MGFDKNGAVGLVIRGIDLNPKAGLKPTSAIAWYSVNN